jgi:hypothetical protein
MHRGHRRARWAFVLSIASSIGVMVDAAPARAGVGAGCEAGAPCVDLDGDGFVACSCAAPGAPCDCDDSDPNAFPGAPEACDGTKDLDCSGDAGRACGTKQGCLRGVCVPECIPLDDFGCAPYAHCETQKDQRLCTGDCSIYGCPPGSTCDDAKTCVPNCNADVRCPFGQRCRGFGCVDAPVCVEEACASVVCPGGSHCAGGACADDCAGVVCPPKRVCLHVTGDGGVVRGACVDRCAPNPCALPKVCDWRTGACLDPTYPEAGLAPYDDTEPEPDALTVGGAGVSCTASGLGRMSMFGAVASALAFALLVTRRAARRARDRA